MKYAMISPVQATIINNARKNSVKAERQAIKKEVFAAIKDKFGIPQDFKCKVETDPTQPDYLVLKVGQKTPPGMTGDKFALRADGKWILAPKLIEAPAEAARWFPVGSNDNFIASLASDHDDFDAGLTDVQGTQTTINGVDFVTRSDGVVFARLPQSAI